VNAIAAANIKSQLESSSSSSSIESSPNTFISECESLLLSINDPDGVQLIIGDLIGHACAATEANIDAKSTAIDMLSWFCSNTQADYSNQLDELIRALLGLFVQKNENILVKAWNCLQSILEPLKANQLLQRLSTIKNAIRLISALPQYSESRLIDNYGVTDSRLYVPGFCLPKKGLSCILPVFKEGLLNGSPDIKESAASVLCECIRLSDSASLKASVMAITGPLIRVLGERYSSSLKSVILDAIYFLLLKVDTTLRPFLPQLQPTFLKNLGDINRVIRLKSGMALARLISMNPKMDTIIVELLNQTKSNEDVLVKETLLNTLRLCLNSVGGKLQEATRSQVLKFCHTDELLFNEEYSLRAVTAGTLGSLVPYLTDKEFAGLLGNDALDCAKYEMRSWKCLQANCILVCVAFKYCPERIVAERQKCLAMLTMCANSDRVPICMSAVRTICFYLEYQIKSNLKVDVEVAQVLAKLINHMSIEIKGLAVQVVTFLSGVSPDGKPLDDSLLKSFIPMLVNGTRENSPLVRKLSELGLVSLLRLNRPESIYQKCLELLVSMKESFQDCIKSLSNESLAATQTANIEINDLDETLLKIEA
jgi:hypothetical protein